MLTCHGSQRGILWHVLRLIQFGTVWYFAREAKKRRKSSRHLSNLRALHALGHPAHKGFIEIAVERRKGFLCRRKLTDVMAMLAWIGHALPVGCRAAGRRVQNACTARMVSAVSPVTSQTVGFLGCGTMAGAVLERLLHEGLLAPEQVRASARSEASLEHLAVDWNVPRENLLWGPKGNEALVQASDVVVLGVKPRMTPLVLAGIASSFEPSRHLLLSLVAGISTEGHARALGSPEARIVRAIPSMAARIGRSTTAMVAGANATPDDVACAESLIGACGFVEVLPEEDMLDAATACLLPNFAYLLLEALADAAVLEGLPRATAQRLAANSLSSAAALAVESPDVHPGTLRNKAESPGGVTIRATRELERGGFRASAMDAVAEATARSRELNGGS